MVSEIHTDLACVRKIISDLTLRDDKSAVVGFTDTPELFGGDAPVPFQDERNLAPARGSFFTVALRVPLHHADPAAIPINADD